MLDGINRFTKRYQQAVAGNAKQLQLTMEEAHDLMASITSIMSAAYKKEMKKDKTVIVSPGVDGGGFKP